MKQTLLLALSSFFISLFMTACTSQKAGQVTDKIVDEMAVVGNPALSSDPCAAIDKKVRKLDRFTAVVKNTSAFHLEEKASAIPTPGITVSNNRKQMLRDADRKYAEYAAERKKYGCAIPVATDIDQLSNEIAMIDSCTAIDDKIMRLDRFTAVVQNTSAFHLEEKASAIPTPGITVSNNRKQMLRDANRKYAEYAAERKKYGCAISVATDVDQMSNEIALIDDKATVTQQSVLSSSRQTAIEKEPIKSDEITTKVNNSSIVDVEEKAAVVTVPKITENNKKAQVVRAEEKKDTEPDVEPKQQSDETIVNTDTPQMADEVKVSENAASSSEACDTIDQELIKLSEFTSMVKNTSAFHLEEKASALPSPGFTVSNNKKKMLRDIEKRYSELLAERQKYGCETAQE